MIQPYLIGSGRSANAIQKSLAILTIEHPGWEIQSPIQIKRGEEFQFDFKRQTVPILFISNPNGLHAQTILKGVAAGFRGVVVEKPACVSREEVMSLRAIATPPIAVLHVYRQTWGIQTLKSMLDKGELGDLICIEGRYWQASAALRAIDSQAKVLTWKNDRHLCGGFDTFLDVGTHWMDAACFLMGAPPVSGKSWLSYANAEMPHRDSHVHANFEFSGGRRAMASISKTVHGATNHFEVNLIGTKKSATWNFLNPDEIQMGVGRSRTVISRQETSMGSRQGAFHGTGWLEGYVEIIRQYILELKNEGDGDYPKLSESLGLIDVMLSS